MIINNRKFKEEDLKILIVNSDKIVGLRQILKSKLEYTIKCVIVSIDSDDFVLSAVEDKFKNTNIPIYKSLKSDEIGKLCKIEVPAAVVAILSKNKIEIS